MSFSDEKTLQNICVKCISSHFERFFLLFNSNFEEHYFPYIKLIRRRYCDQLLGLLSDKKSLKNEYLTFLINKYSTELDLQKLVACNFCSIEERLKEVGSVVTKFSMVNVKQFNNINGFLRHLSNIQSLQLSETNCTDSAIEIIAENCSSLKSLDLCGCAKVTDKGLTLLCMKNPPLEYLNVEYTSVSYVSVALILKNIPSLTRLSFDNVPRAIFEAAGWSDASEINASQIFNLHNIVILNNPMRPENHLTVVLQGCTKVCPHIKDLIVSELITDEQLELCSRFSNVDTVMLQCSTIGNPKLCINSYLELRGDKLTSLQLINFTLSVEVLANFCPNLECLTLQYPTFQNPIGTDISFPYLKKFSLLHVSLEILENQIAASLIISSSQCLAELHIKSCIFPDEMQNVVLSYPKGLTVLNFSHTIVNPVFLQEVLHEHSQLSHLVIDNSGITMTDFDDLMDIVDEREKKVQITWADFSEAIRELFCDVPFNVQKRCVLKL